MPEYHHDSVCGCCGGPLECDRDAVCESCVREAVYFEQVAIYQEAAEAAKGQSDIEIRATSRKLGLRPGPME